MMKNYLKLIVAAVLLLCLCSMPYGFYTLVRFGAMAAFVWMAYDYYKQKKEGLTFTFGAFAVLFQPFIKIALGRDAWNFVDVLIAGLLIFLFWNENKSKKS